MTAVTKQLKVEIFQKNEAKRRVYGYGYVTKTADGKQVVDAHGDTIFDEDLEDAVVDFVKHYRRGGEMHRGAAANELIGAFPWTEDIQKGFGVPDGTMPKGMLVAFEVTEEAWAKVLKGDYLMFSIEGEISESETVEVES